LGTLTGVGFASVKRAKTDVAGGPVSLQGVDSSPKGGVALAHAISNLLRQ